MSWGCISQLAHCAMFRMCPVRGQRRLVDRSDEYDVGVIANMPGDILAAAYLEQSGNVVRNGLEIGECVASRLSDTCSFRRIDDTWMIIVLRRSVRGGVDRAHEPVASCNRCPALIVSPCSVSTARACTSPSGRLMFDAPRSRRIWAARSS